MSFDESDYPWEVRRHPEPREVLYILERGYGASFARFNNDGMPFPTKESAQRKADELNRRLASPKPLNSADPADNPTLNNFLF